MKFSVGYQFFDETETSMAARLCGLREHIEEVYFPWPDMETCRPSAVNVGGRTEWAAQSVLEEDLALLRQSGIKLNLLLNANCYGERAMSHYLRNRIASLIGYLCGLLSGPPEKVTTASPFIAAQVKALFPEVRTIASVNMRIGSVKAMEYLADVFDGYCVQREFNRMPARIKEFKQWADAHGKSLHILANSGCMRFCSGQIFHDNAVAHERELAEMHNVENFNPAVCWTYYSERKNWPSLLQNTWLRPEDVRHYEGLFGFVKLATRQTARPMAVVRAYIAGEYRGNLLDLLEPNHTALLQGFYLDNSRFPPDWFERTSTCNGACHACGYCAEVLEQVLCRSVC